MRLSINTPSDRGRVAQEILALTVTHPLEVNIRRAVKRLTDAKRAKIHIVLRAAAHHFGYSESAMKQYAKAGELDGVDWPRVVEEGGLGAIDAPMDTMDLPDKDAEVLLIQLEAWAANAGVPLEAHETMEVA
jgi:hypothetical protein